jgi:transposase
MRVSLSAMRNKTDRNDARGIAQIMRLGWFRAVHVKNIEMQKLRTLLANRKLLKHKLVDIGNHIRGALRAYGLLVGAVSRGRFDARIRELIEHADYVFTTMIETMLEARKAIFDDFEKLHKIVLRVVQHDTVCRRLMTVSGCRPRCVAIVQSRRGRSTTLHTITNRWRAFWPHAQAPSIGHFGAKVTQRPKLKPAR